MTVKIGQITYNDTDGNVAYTGVGFEPIAVIFWGYDTAAHATIERDLRVFIGFAADDGIGNISQGVTAVSSNDEGAASISDGRMVNACISMIDLIPNVQYEASLVSMDADGFTLNWTNTADPSPTKLIFYMALGGADITAASVVEWTTPTSTGNKSVTGAGFQPDAVLHISAVVTTEGNTASAVLWFGAMTTAAQWALQFYSQDVQLNSNTQRYQNTDRCLVNIDTSQAVNISAAYVSMDADGFTVNFNPVGASAIYVYSLCIETDHVVMGSFSKPAAPTASTAVSGIGFAPAGVLLVTDNHGVGATGGSNFSLGAASAAGGYGGAVHDDDAQANMVADGYSMNNACIADISASAANYIGDIDSLDTDGFTVGWPTNDAATDTIMYMAIGEVAAGQPTSLRDWVKHVGRPWRPGRGL